VVVGDGRIDAFELFCSYHLGLNTDGTYRASNLHEVARRFGLSPSALKQALQDHLMDPDTVIHSEFDMAMAQVDIQVSPPGVSKLELARGIYQEYLNVRSSDRSWEDQLDNDQAPDAQASESE